MCHVLMKQGAEILRKQEGKFSAKYYFCKRLFISTNTKQVVELLFQSSVK